MTNVRWKSASGCELHLCVFKPHWRSLVAHTKWLWGFPDGSINITCFTVTSGHWDAPVWRHRPCPFTMVAVMSFEDFEKKTGEEWQQGNRRTLENGAHNQEWTGSSVGCQNSGEKRWHMYRRWKLNGEYTSEMWDIPSHFWANQCKARTSSLIALADRGVR